MTLHSKASMNTYFIPTTMSYRKLLSYIDIYRHFLSLKPCSDSAAKKKTTIKTIDIWTWASLPI